jgi:hypothetical protein
MLFAAKKLDEYDITIAAKFKETNRRLVASKLLMSITGSSTTWIGNWQATGFCVNDPSI